MSKLLEAMFDEIEFRMAKRAERQQQKLAARVRDERVKELSPGMRADLVLLATETREEMMLASEHVSTGTS